MQEIASTPRVQDNPKELMSLERRQLRSKIRKTKIGQARLPHRHNMQLQQQEQRECAQLIQDEETGEYLNYRQLIRGPKHEELWQTSIANEFFKTCARSRWTNKTAN